MNAERPNSLGDRGPTPACGRSVRLTWTDPVTRDRIAVDLLGSEDFLRELLELGFELAPDGVGAEAPAPDAIRRRASAHARSTRPRAGDAA